MSKSKMRNHIAIPMMKLICLICLLMGLAVVAGAQPPAAGNEFWQDVKAGSITAHGPRIIPQTFRTA